MPPDSQPVPLDPALLAAFRQQGAAIVARERGLTSSCRIKLAGAAQSLGIADEQVEQAIRSLAAVEPNSPPNAQAEKFRRRLSKDLAGKSRTIIGPTIEAQILAAAKRKYGLDEEAAGQVLGEVAGELKLTRITASDAIQSLTAQIDQAAGDSAWLAREAWDRLRSAGGKWGLELEVIDELIEERLAANRTDYALRSAWTRATLFGAGGAVLAAGVIVAGLVLARSMKEDSRSAEAAPAAAMSATNNMPATPAWWDVELSVEMAHARSQVKELAPVCDLMRSNSAAQRTAGYERLIDQVRAAPENAELLAAAARLVAGCHALEPDENAASRLRAALLGLLPSVDASLPASAVHWSIPFWAAETSSAALDRRGSKSERTAALADDLSAALGAAIDPAMPRAERQRLLRERTALAAYRQLAAAANRQPANVAGLYPALAQRAAIILSEDERLRAETALLIEALPAAGRNWKVYERPLVRCISSPDPIYALRLIDALRRATDARLVEHLSKLLIVRAGARPKSAGKKDVIAAVRQALAGGASLTAADRWATLEDEAQAALAAPAAADERQRLAQTVALTQLTTLAIALAQGEAGFASFDAGLAHPRALDGARSGEASAEPALSFSKPAVRSLTKSQQRDLARYIETLARHNDGARPEREAALRGLAALGDETADITPQQATPIANYLLAEKSADEHAKTLTALAELRRWNHLRLAVADGLATAKIGPDRLLDIAAALVGSDVRPGQSADDLRRLLMTTVQGDLDENSSHSQPLAGGPALDRAESIIADSYRRRAGLLNATPAAVSAATGPAQALELCIAALDESQTRGNASDSPADRLPHVLKAAKYLANDDLRYCVAVQRLLVERSARRLAARRPERAGAARQIAAESLASYAAAPSALAQLHDQESALLKLWMLYAPEA
jgi:hypothetical protein